MRFSAAVCVVAFALTACTASSNPPAPAPGLSKAAQRAQAQASMAIANGIGAASLIGVVLQSFKVTPLAASAKPVCTDGVETTLKVTTPENLTLTIDAFYDSICTKRLNHAVLAFTIFPPGLLSIAGKSTTYATSGKPVAYATLATKGKLGVTDQTTTTGTISTSPGGPAVAAFGLSCTLAATNRCGFGGVATISPSQALGVTSTLDGFSTSGTHTGTVALLAYQGAPGTLKLVAGKGNAWAISGGTLAAAQTGTFLESVDPNSLEANGTLAMSDSQAGASTALAFGTRTGIAGGFVAQTATSKHFATYSANAAGSGSIDYSNGSTGNIALFIITP